MNNVPRTRVSERLDFTDLFVFEMANNHQGSVAHGKKIIRAMGEIARRHGIKAAIKFQFRDLDTFVHPAHKKKSQNKHVPRFLSTRLSERDFGELTKEARVEGLVVMATPFDESSVDMAEKLSVEILKIASCSAADFPLLERVAQSGKPVIASTGGLSIAEIDNLVTFFDHRYVHLAIEHCVAIYPTPVEKLQLEQIAVLKRRYPLLTVGFSTHEPPENTENIQMAYAKGARIFEKHVGVEAPNIQLNAYSANPDQIEKWIQAWERARAAMGVPEKVLDAKETEDLAALKRGVFAKKNIKKGQKIISPDVYFAFPIEKGQLPSGRFAEGLIADRDYKKDEAIDVNIKKEEFSPTHTIYQIVHAVKGMLNEAGIQGLQDADLELSHHYGLENFHTHGVVIIDCINREYCKKILVQLPGQAHPNHHHLKKEEAFHILSGQLEVEISGRHKTLRSGDVQVVPRGAKHNFWTEIGVIFEEVSTTHFNDDSMYEDPKIARMPREARKTKLINWGFNQFK